jgi:hypothetical protein
MDLLERTRVVVDLLTGSDIQELAKLRGLDPHEVEAWLRGFMEGGIAALERMRVVDSRQETEVVPRFRTVC